MSASGYPRTLLALARHIGMPLLAELLQRFLYDQLNPNGFLTGDDVPLHMCPQVGADTKFFVFHSAVATFFAPSDDSGIHGMRCERIRSTPSWRGRGPRRDCAFVVQNQAQRGFEGMSVVRVHLFFSFQHGSRTYPSALVEWFSKVGRGPNADTNLWMLHRDYHMQARRLRPHFTVVHLDSLLRCAHLIPAYGPAPLPIQLRYTHSLDCFDYFWLNKYIDHHAFELLS